MSYGEIVNLQARERLAAIAASVPSPFSEQETSIHGSVYECFAKAIGERLAASVIFHGTRPSETPGDLLEAIVNTADNMLSTNDTNRSRFLNDEMAVAFAMHVYKECIENLNCN